MSPDLTKCLHSGNEQEQGGKGLVVVLTLTDVATNFNVLLTVHLSIILVINQLDAQNLVL